MEKIHKEKGVSDNLLGAGAVALQKYMKINNLYKISEKDSSRSFENVFMWIEKYIMAVTF